MGQLPIFNTEIEDQSRSLSTDFSFRPYRIPMDFGIKFKFQITVDAKAAALFAF